VLRRRRGCGNLWNEHFTFCTLVKHKSLDLDRTDLRILDALQNDAALSASALAERCSITTTTAWRRLQRLENGGAIKSRVAVLDRRAVGLHVLVFAQVKLAATGRESLAKFEQAVRRHPEVLDCYSLLGDKDFILRIVVPSIEAYEAFFLDHLSRMPGVQAVNSTIALSTIKESTALPLPTA
jgi:Lrp/AsnC family transcriptional regulator